MASEAGYLLGVKIEIKKMPRPCDKAGQEVIVVTAMGSWKAGHGHGGVVLPEKCCQELGQ